MEWKANQMVYKWVGKMMMKGKSESKRFDLEVIMISIFEEWSNHQSCSVKFTVYGEGKKNLFLSFRTLEGKEREKV